MRFYSRVESTAEPTLPCISRFAFILAILTLVLATAWSPVPQEEKVTIVGQVIHGTPGGSIPSDLEVSLHVFSGVEEKEALTTTPADDGSFHFDDLSLEEGDTCVARVVYADVMYISDFMTFESGQQEIGLAVTVYETTEDPSTVQVTQMHTFISQVSDRIQVEENYLISNIGDRTYVGQEASEGEQRVTLSHTLPDGAEALAFDGSGLGERYLEHEGGFGDTEPIIPGNVTLETSFSYMLPYQEGMQVERTFDAPVQSIVMLLVGEELGLEGQGIIPGDSMDTRMGPATSYIAGPLAAGEPLIFDLVAQPQAMIPPSSPAPTGSTPTRNTARETSVGLVVLAAAVVIVYLLWRPSTSQLLPASARPLVQEIAALDGDFDTGQIPEESYRQKRKALKEQLYVLLRNANNG